MASGPRLQVSARLRLVFQSRALRFFFPGGTQVPPFFMVCDGAAEATGRAGGLAAESRAAPSDARCAGGHCPT